MWVGQLVCDIHRFYILGLGAVLIGPLFLWLKVIGNWKKLHDVWLHKLYWSSDIRIVEESKKDEWLDHVV
jgi:hypothetical protein